MNRRAMSFSRDDNKSFNRNLNATRNVLLLSFYNVKCLITISIILLFNWFGSWVSVRLIRVRAAVVVHER